MGYARSLGGDGSPDFEAIDMQQDAFAGYRVKRPQLPDWAYVPPVSRDVTSNLAQIPAVRRLVGNKKVRCKDGRMVPTRAPGTRLYVPGFLGDDEQAALDMMQDQFGDIGKLRISFKHPFGRHSIFGKGVRLVGKVAKVAVPIAAGGLALKFGLPLAAKGLRAGISLFRHKPGIPAAPMVTPPSQVALDTAAAITQQAMSTLLPGQVPPEAVVTAAAPPQVSPPLPGAQPSVSPAALGPTPGPMATADMPGGELPTGADQGGGNGGGPQAPALASMFGNIDPKMIGIGALVLFLVTQQKGGRRRR